MTNLFSFRGGEHGAWRVVRTRTLCGEALRPVERVDIAAGATARDGAGWVLRGLVSNIRYVTGAEPGTLKTVQEIGRAHV